MTDSWIKSTFKQFIYFKKTNNYEKDYYRTVDAAGHHRSAGTGI